MRITAGQVMRWAVVMAVVGVALSCVRSVPIRQKVTVHEFPANEHSGHRLQPATVLNADVVQTVAVITRLSAPGVVEKVELDSKRVGCCPILIITTKECNGSIRKDYIVLDGLVLEPVAEDRVITLVKPAFRAEEF